MTLLVQIHKILCFDYKISIFSKKCTIWPLYSKMPNPPLKPRILGIRKHLIFNTNGSNIRCYSIYFNLLKCSIVSAFITLLSPIIPIRLGIAINPFMVSEMLHIRLRLPTAPTKTNII